MKLRPACDDANVAQDINKLVQLDTNLADVVDGLQGGLTAGFVHQMLSHKISFQASAHGGGRPSPGTVDGSGFGGPSPVVSSCKRVARASCAGGDAVAGHED